jgi:uncharacterized protein (TIGR03437 family)
LLKVLSSSGGAVLFELDGALDGYVTWPFPRDRTNPRATPANLEFSVRYAEPGTYRGNVTITTTLGTITVPVVTYVTATPEMPPVISSVTNSASNRSTSLAPGEILTIRGRGVGPARAGLTLDSAGRIRSETAGSRVLIDGTPAPILYASPEQWNVIVPYELDGKTSASVRVISGGIESKPWTLPVARVSPAVFTIGSTGVGRGAILNQDNTVNNPSNPAPVGTILQIFANGGGQSTFTNITGSVTPSTGGGRLRLPVKVTIGGYDAPVVFAGPAPGLASGAVQINAVIPTTVFGQAATAVTVEIDGVVGPGVTASIR